MNISERKLRRLQKQRHMYDVQMTILSNPLLKNLSKRDQKAMGKLIYKAEMTEMFIRDRSMTRVNQSFDDIIEKVFDILDEGRGDEEERRRQENDEDF
jgi:TRAP-type C4-dicarboxylate transport system substrate-binding protein